MGVTAQSSRCFEEALAFASRAHGAIRQARKGTSFPYVSHPIRVAEILTRFEYSDDVVVAGFLHDTIEDTNLSFDEISETFSPRIADLVRAASEPDKSLPWKIRKEHTILGAPSGVRSRSARARRGRQAGQRTLDHRLVASSREREDMGALQREADRAALVLPGDRGGTAQQGPRKPTLPYARLRDADPLPRSANECLSSSSAGVDSRRLRHVREAS